MSGLSLQNLKIKRILLMTFTKIKIFSLLCRSQLVVEMLAKTVFLVCFWFCFLALSTFEPVGDFGKLCSLCFYYLTSGKIM